MADTQIQPVGGQGDIAPLADPHRVESDCKMISKAVRLGWPVKAKVRRVVVDRLVDIVEKTTVEVPTKEGSFASAFHADGNAVAAARVLVAMHGQNQKDREGPSPVGGNVNNGPTQINYYMAQPPKEDASDPSGGP